MHRFFAERLNDKTAKLTADEARHALTVLRLQPGDPIQLILEGQLFRAVLEETAPDVTARIEGTLPSPEAATRITLYQGLPKADKVDWVVQKGTEAGIAAFRVFEARRSVTRLEGKDSARREERWQRIAREAAKQAGRAAVPTVEVVSARQVLSLLKAHDLVLVPWEDARHISLAQALREHPQAWDIAVVIGPEGGFGAEEVDQFQAAGGIPVTLGPRIFRTETAGLAAAVMTLYERGEYEYRAGEDG